MIFLQPAPKLLRLGKVNGLLICGLHTPAISHRFIQIYTDEQKDVLNLCSIGAIVAATALRRRELQVRRELIIESNKKVFT